MVTSRQRTEFGENLSEKMGVRDWLEQAIEWISGNLNPRDVFDLHELIGDVADICHPEDVFGEMELTAWAKANGFTKG